MSEWKTVRLGDVCEIAAGQGAPQGDSNYCDEGTPFVKAGNLIELIEGKSEKQIQKVSEEVAKSHKLKKYKASSILFAKSGMSCMKGYVYQLKNDCYVVSHLAIVKPKEDFSDYIEYCLRHIKPNTLVKDEAYPSISLQDISNLQIPLPPLETQKQIAAVLDKCTSLISKYKQILKKYDTLIKSRFIEMFGDPVQNPMGWEVKKLGKMCSAIMNGTTPKGGEQVYVENGITFLRSQNVWRNKIDLDDVAYIDEATHKSMKKSSLKKYDILMTKTGRINTENSSLGRAALFLGEDDSANINGHVYLIRLEKEYNHEFVIRILTSPEYRDYIRSICVGGIDKRQVNKDHIEDFPIIQPPKELQDEYSAFVQQIDKSKFAVQKSLEKAETLYKSLMQEYFG